MHCEGINDSGTHNGTRSDNGTGGNNGGSSSGWAELDGPAQGSDLQRFRITDRPLAGDRIGECRAKPDVPTHKRTAVHG